ncbi:hypothetical protein [Guyparkeria sp. SB14A]|uniref:hypothetical protein n=1 Tax=Guyparkeria sp. SB14A TaxID=2571147 RepID=UPI001FFDCC04|nr:hypothetical protein [Guyparkeria sp. SB14A]
MGVSRLAHQIRPELGFHHDQQAGAQARQHASLSECEIEGRVEMGQVEGACGLGAGLGGGADHDREIRPTRAHRPDQHGRGAHLAQ